MIQYVQCSECGFILCKCSPTSQPKAFEGLEVVEDPNQQWLEISGEING